MKNIIVNSLRGLCSKYEGKKKRVYESSTNLIKIDLNGADCEIGDQIVYFNDFDISFNQYLYFIFDNRFFKSDYMIVETADFYNQFNNILTEVQNEYKQIKALKSQKEKTDVQIDFILEIMKEASTKNDVEIECDQFRTGVKVYTCREDKFEICKISLTNIDGLDYYNIKFFNKISVKNIKKFFNEIKVPKEAPYDISHRIESQASSFFKTYHNLMQRSHQLRYKI